MLRLLDAALPGPAHGVFTTRQGGVSAAPWHALNLALHVEDEPGDVEANRRLLTDQLGGPTLVFAEQVHGVEVAVVDRARSTGAPGADALVTTVPGLALTILGADCLPVLLAGNGVVGAAHVGRNGLALGVLAETVRVMREQAPGADEVTAAIGPGVCGRCYELPADLADQVGQAAPGSRATSRAGRPSVDLRAGARRQLQAAGVTVTASVTEHGGCTQEQPELFYSYRRDGRTGRHGGVVWLA